MTAFGWGCLERPWVKYFRWLPVVRAAMWALACMAQSVLVLCWLCGSRCLLWLPHVHSWSKPEEKVERPQPLVRKCVWERAQCPAFKQRRISSLPLLPSPASPVYLQPRPRPQGKWWNRSGPTLIFLWGVWVPPQCCTLMASQREKLKTKNASGLLVFGSAAPGL